MKDTTCRILCSYDLVISEVCEIIGDMRVLNCRGNQDGSKFQVFWDATARVIEMDTGYGAHI